jgi:DNA repair photolyase
MNPAEWPKARGAKSNPKPRFDRLEREAVDDGWTPEEEPPTAPGTTIHIDKTKSVITRNTSPDIGFDRSINPYRGCAHGCVYCFARPTHAYLDLSPGLDFETQLFVKPDAPRLLESELRKPGYRPAVIAIGTNTDPYQPIEREHRIMRGCLEVLAAFNHPVSITTKSFLVTRDIDILGPMAAKGLAAVAVSVTTLDRDLHRKLEPRAATPAKRLDAIRLLAASGIPTTVMAAPVIPRINDHELEDILAAAKEAGAQNAACILLRLPYEVKDLFAEWLEAHFPDRAEHVLSLVAQQRNGKLYDATFGTRHTGTGAHAELLAQRFRIAQKKLGLGGVRFKLDASQFRAPAVPGDQLSLLL